MAAHRGDFELILAVGWTGSSEGGEWKHRKPRSTMRLLALLSILSGLALTACVTPRDTDTSLQPVPVTAPGDSFHSASHAKPESELPPPQPLSGSAPRNRDLHGPADTQDYIARLQSEDRLRELKPQLVADKLRDELQLASSAVIADIGCGPGVFAGPFSALVPSGIVYAVDVEPAQLDVVRARIQSEGLANVVPVLASYTTPHLPPNSIDVAFIADTYHHIDERVPYFAELAASLRPNGVLVILEYKEGDIPVGPPADHKIPVATRHAELERAGFELRTTLATHLWQDLEIWQRRRIFR